MHEDDLGRVGEGTKTIATPAGQEDLGIGEIVDALHRGRGREERLRLFLEPIRHGRDGVDLAQAEAHHVPVGRILSDQRDVGAVQRGDDGRVAGREHLAGEVGGDGMGNGVVDVEEIELVLAVDLGQTRREGDRVWHRLEHRIVQRTHFVVEDALLGAQAKPMGPGTGDEVDLVAAAREHAAQFAGEHPGSTDGWNA